MVWMSAAKPMEVDHPNKRLTSRARAVTRSPHESAGSLLLINLIQIFNLIIFVVIRIEDALSVRWLTRRTAVLPR